MAIGEMTPKRIESTCIVYTPHCGECGFPIDTSEHEVAYQDIYERVFGMELCRKVCANVYPSRCSHCGAPFHGIETTPPKKLEDIYLLD